MLRSLIRQAPKVRLGMTVARYGDNDDRRGPVGRVFDIIIFLRGPKPEYCLPVLDDELQSEIPTASGSSVAHRAAGSDVNAGQSKPSRIDWFGNDPPAMRSALDPESFYVDCPYVAEAATHVREEPGFIEALAEKDRREFWPTATGDTRGRVHPCPVEPIGTYRLSVHN